MERTYDMSEAIIPEKHAELGVRINAALAELRPYLEADYGDITLKEITDDLIVKLELHGSCVGCSMINLTMTGGVVIVANGGVIARGHNLCEQLHDFTAHAEMQAFTSASEFLGGKFLDTCTLYVTLEPCPMCASAGFLTRVGRVVFGAYDLKRGYQRWEVAKSKKGHGGHSGENGLLHPKTEILGGVLEEECSQLIKNFFVKKRKKLR